MSWRRWDPERHLRVSGQGQIPQLPKTYHWDTQPPPPSWAGPPASAGQTSLCEPSIVLDCWGGPLQQISTQTGGTILKSLFLVLHHQLETTQLRWKCSYMLMDNIAEETQLSLNVTLLIFSLIPSLTLIFGSIYSYVLFTYLVNCQYPISFFQYVITLCAHQVC